LLAARQDWRLIDNDTELLAQAMATPTLERVTASALVLDLNRDLEGALQGPIDLVTTSALLDLVSKAWLERLAVTLAARSIPFYAALSYDGRIELAPRDPFDMVIAAAVNAHQRTDKGFGPALGPEAAAFAKTSLESNGYSLRHGVSDWFIAPTDCKMQSEILSGWANASINSGKVIADDAGAWLTRRQHSVAGGHSSIRVGHVDIFAVPMRTR
jgi:hypothetical protein